MAGMVSVGGMEPMDVSGSLIRGTLIASLVIAFLLVLYLYQKDGFSGLGNMFSNGFGWFK